VDPISHVAFGGTLVATRTGWRYSDRRSLALMLGALAPDIDAVLMPAGWDIYLRAHQVGTHSIVGTVPLACLVAVVVSLVRSVRLEADRVIVETALAAWIGCLSHLLLDAISGAQMRLGWPIIDGRISIPLVAMAEPFLVGLFAIGTVALIAVRRFRRLTACCVLALLLLFFAGKGVLLAAALSTLPSGAERVVNRIIEAKWASLTEWRVYQRLPASLQEWSIKFGQPATLRLSWPLESESTLAHQSRTLTTVTNFLSVHDFAFPAESTDEAGVRRVLWSDVRYCWRVPRDILPDPIVSVDTPRGTIRLACALWFGGSFDRTGQPIKQLVKVGGWWQVRSAGR
jgi:membrane-bound metal-dependent hydrolase YbcI (DUF457 family)